MKDGEQKGDEALAGMLLPNIVSISGRKIQDKKTLFGKGRFWGPKYLC